MQKVWFAEKQNGEIITLTEEEALTHFEQNQIRNRMMLRFLGTSDGSKYNEGQKRVQEIVMEKIKEAHPEFAGLDRAGKAMVEKEVREENIMEIKQILDDAFKAELEQAKANGVQKPDPNLRIQTRGGNRQKIINQMSSM